MTWPDSLYATYDYSAADEVTAIRENGVTSGAGVLATFGYDDLGRRTSLTRGNGTVTSYGYDGLSRLSSLTHDLPGTANDVTTSFTYSQANQIISQTRTNDAYAWGGATNVNRGHVSNGLNQLTTTGSTSLGYDTRGNLTSSGTNSYNYSSENLLTSATVGGVASTLTYDPLMRLYQTAATDTRRFLYDGADIIAEYDGSGTMVRRYVHGPGEDEPLVQYAGNTSFRSWLHADERGSIVARSDASGGAQLNRYDEFGIPAATNTARFQYTGQIWLPEIGMYHYKARLYSPTLGRFMQTDPIGYGEGVNWHAYVGNDPINARDPSGMNCAGIGNASCSGQADAANNGANYGAGNPGIEVIGKLSGCFAQAFGCSDQVSGLNLTRDPQNFGQQSFFGGAQIGDIGPIVVTGVNCKKHPNDSHCTKDENSEERRRRLAILELARARLSRYCANLQWNAAVSGFLWGEAGGALVGGGDAFRRYGTLRAAIRGAGRALINELAVSVAVGNAVKDFNTGADGDPRCKRDSILD